jgi:hypothetical protein
MLRAKSAFSKAKRSLRRARPLKVTFDRTSKSGDMKEAMWEWLNEADPDDIKLLASAGICFFGSIMALLVYYFYR